MAKKKKAARAYKRATRGGGFGRVYRRSPIRVSRASSVLSGEELESKVMGAIYRLRELGAFRDSTGGSYTP